jgi:hypothetical protein
MDHNQIHTLRENHKSISAIVPLVTAALTISGVVLARMERNAKQEAQRAQAADPMQFAHPYAFSPRVTRVVPVVSPMAASVVSQPVAYRPRRLTLLGYLGTLLSRVLLVLIGMVLVATTVGVYFASDPTWRAIELTALILLILYLAERVARARRG